MNRKFSGIFFPDALEMARAQIEAKSYKVLHSLKRATNRQSQALPRGCRKGGLPQLSLQSSSSWHVKEDGEGEAGVSRPRHIVLWHFPGRTTQRGR